MFWPREKSHSKEMKADPQLTRSLMRLGHFEKLVGRFLLPSLRGDPKGQLLEAMLLLPVETLPQLLASSFELNVTELLCVSILYVASLPADVTHLLRSELYEQHLRHLPPMHEFESCRGAHWQLANGLALALHRVAPRQALAAMVQRHPGWAQPGLWRQILLPLDFENVFLAAPQLWADAPDLCAQFAFLVGERPCLYGCLWAPHVQEEERILVEAHIPPQKVPACVSVNPHLAPHSAKLRWEHWVLDARAVAAAVGAADDPPIMDLSVAGVLKDRLDLLAHMAVAEELQQNWHLLAEAGAHQVCTVLRPFLGKDFVPAPPAHEQWPCLCSEEVWYSCLEEDTETLCMLVG
jgi:hypothetical protein